MSSQDIDKKQANFTKAEQFVDLYIYNYDGIRGDRNIEGDFPYHLQEFLDEWNEPKWREYTIYTLIKRYRFDLLKNFYLPLIALVKREFD